MPGLKTLQQRGKQKAKLLVFRRQFMEFKNNMEQAAKKRRLPEARTQPQEIGGHDCQLGVLHDTSGRLPDRTPGTPPLSSKTEKVDWDRALKRMRGEDQAPNDHWDSDWTNDATGAYTDALQDYAYALKDTSGSSNNASGSGCKSGTKKGKAQSRWQSSQSGPNDVDKKAVTDNDSDTDSPIIVD